MPDTTTTTGTTGTTGNTGTATNTGVGLTQSSSTGLSGWAAPYVTEMLGRGEALSSMPYQAYTGPLTAGQSQLQNQAFQGLAGLAVPQTQSYTPQSFTDPNVAGQYMNPYLQSALQPQIDEARRQAEIQKQQMLSGYTKAGAFGGGRQAIASSEADRNLLQNLAGITGKGYQSAYDAATAQFNAEQNRQQQAANLSNQYGLQALAAQTAAGGTQRDIEQQGIAADLAQFQEQRDYPLKQVQYMQSLLNQLPISTTNYSYTQPSTLSNILTGSGSLLDAYNRIYGGDTSGTSGTTGNTGTTSQPV